MCVVACSHALVVFGGVQGLETSLDADDSLDIDDPSLLFDHYLNTCPQQGSNTIRTEVQSGPAYCTQMSAGFPRVNREEYARDPLISV